ncbi:MAG TPA: hypothetical protein VKR30_04810 [Candidatus Limnocylindrales bacterium]|nr:hypothetical protein [Candidatus Limnocylindrales bacterium]
MKPADRPRCLVCGSTANIQRNHVAARANHRTLTFPMCPPCHAAFTDWQWRLGMLRHETPAERSAHDELERAWALVEGFVVTVALGSEPGQSAAAVALGRAAGIVLAVGAEATDGPPRWGPKPARRKGPAEPAPEARGTIALEDWLRLGLEVAAELGAGDPRLAGIAAGAEAIAQQAAAIDEPGRLARGPELEAITARTNATLATVGAIGSLEDLAALDGELRELADVADQTLRLLAALATSESTEAATAAVEAAVEPHR